MRDISTNELLNSANTAYDVLTNLGPFYGNDPNKIPTFRVAAEPLILPPSYQEEYLRIGKAILELSNVIEANSEFSDDCLHPCTPMSWRIDSIIDEDGSVKVNEINVPDGADALMVAEQRAYSLAAPYGISTPEAYVAYFDSRNNGNTFQQIATIAENMSLSPYTPNVMRMAELIEAESRGRYKVKIIDRKDISQIHDWEDFLLVINNGGYISPEELIKCGLPIEKLVSAGSFSKIGSKAIFAAVHNDSDRLLRDLPKNTRVYLQSIFPYTEILDYDSSITALTKGESVVKAYSAPNGHTKRLERGRGVVGPWNSIDERLAIRRLLDMDVKFIEQEFIKPKRFDVHLRSKAGRALKLESRFNRICVKYVNIEFAGGRPIPTAVEATLGTKVVPTGRDTCFLPVHFSE